jgi:ATP-dependent Clp protease ATP-binding subunit ClpC
MFERFTEKSLRIILFAQDEAKRTGHNFVGTEHLLVGLIEEGSEITLKAFKNGGIKLADVKREITKLIGKGSGFVPVEIPFTPRAKSILEQSLEKARSFNHSYIETEHILLTLLDDAEGIAMQVLTKLKFVNIYKIRRTLLEELGQIVDPVFVDTKKKEEEIQKKVEKIIEQNRQKRIDNRNKLIQERKERFEKYQKFKKQMKELKGKLETPKNPFNFTFKIDFEFDDLELDDLEFDDIIEADQNNYSVEQDPEEFEHDQDTYPVDEESEELQYDKNDFTDGEDSKQIEYDENDYRADETDYLRYEKKKNLDNIEAKNVFATKKEEVDVDEELYQQFLRDIEEIFKGKIQDPTTDTPMLKQFSTNLSLLALEDKLDPVVGRKKEVERVTQILSRRRKNNPILIGEPGVGKTAVAEGLALKIYSQEVASCLSNKEVIVLDVSSLLAGTKFRGEFEERLKRIMSEVKMKKNIILVIDEVHTIVGAGAAEGSLDAANILKPALARGELQCIGATTLDEYKQIEKDPALERRFQPVFIAEPTKEECFQILKGLRLSYENFHHVRLPNDTLKACVDLSSIYIKDRFLPDKAIDLIDEASSRLKLSNLLDKRGFIKNHEEELKNILEEKDFLLRSQDFEGAAKLRDREMVLRNQIRGFLYSIKASRRIIKKKESLPIVGVDEVNEVLTSWTGIPLTKVGKEEAKKLLNLEKQMQKRVIGQQKAVTSICSAIQRARVGMRNPNRPIASFLFCGPTGVGKTELTKTLAENFFGSETAMSRFDMSEFMERHTVAKLIGSPPGYIGYNEGGQLTEAVKRKPFSLILFDEVEKAHPDIFNLFLQLLDDGRLTDSKGKTVDFTNTIIIMTSNLGSKHIDNELTRNEKQKNDNEKNDTIKNSSLAYTIEKETKFSNKSFDINFDDSNYLDLEYTDPATDAFGENFSNLIEKKVEDNKSKEESDKIENLVKNEIKSFFRPEFINRIDEIIIFQRLKKNHISEIYDLMLKEVHNRLLEKNIFLHVNEKAKEYIVDQGYDPSYGAREIRRSITSHLENKVTLTILETQVITLRSIVLVEYDEYRKIHSYLYPLPSFVLSPFKKEIMNCEENQKAILSFIGVIEDWKKEYIQPKKYLSCYYENTGLYKETEKEEKENVKEARKEIMEKVNKLFTSKDKKD